MMGVPALSAALTGAAPESVWAAPLHPSRDEARKWATHELSDPDYGNSDVTFFGRIGRAVSQFFSELLAPLSDVNSPWLLVALLIVIAAVVALIVWRVRSGSGSALDPQLFARPVIEKGADPGALRASARAAAARSEWRRAVQDQLRAVMAQLAQRGEIDISAASTAAELAAAAGAARPAAAAELGAAGALFDAVTFGERQAQRTDYERLCVLDERMRDHASAARDHAPTAGAR